MWIKVGNSSTMINLDKIHYIHKFNVVQGNELKTMVRFNFGTPANNMDYPCSNSAIEDLFFVLGTMDQAILMNDDDDLIEDT